MALTEVAIHSPAVPYHINRVRPICSPAGVAWTADRIVQNVLLDLRAIDLHTDTQLCTIAQSGLDSIHPICVDPVTSTMYGDDLLDESDWNRFWRVTTAGVRNKYQTSVSGEHHHRNGCVDSAGNIWFGDKNNVNLVRINNLVDATLPTMGTATRTKFLSTPLATCEYLGNPGAIAGRVYYRTLNGNTTGTRGIAWINISTGVRTQIYTAVGNHQPYACVDPAGFIYLMDGNSTTGLFTLRKITSDGTNVTSVSFGGQTLNNLVVDRTGHLWMDVSEGTSRTIRLFDKDTLTELDSLPVFSGHDSVWNYDFNENCMLLYQTPLTGINFQIFTICAAAGEIVVEQPRIFVTT